MSEQLTMQSFENIEKVLDRDGVFASVTEGTSMRPLFKTHRDMIVVEKCSDRLKKHDVALYKTGEKYILHRIVKIDEKNGVYIIRGDNTYVNEHIPFDAVIGRLITFNRNGKHHSVKELGFRLYSAAWVFFYPIRKIAYKSLRAVYKAFKRRK